MRHRCANLRAHRTTKNGAKMRPRPSRNRAAAQQERSVTVPGPSRQHLPIQRTPPRSSARRSSSARRGVLSNPSNWRNGSEVDTTDRIHGGEWLDQRPCTSQAGGARRGPDRAQRQDLHRQSRTTRGVRPGRQKRSHLLGRHGCRGAGLEERQHPGHRFPRPAAHPGHHRRAHPRAQRGRIQLHPAMGRRANAAPGPGDAE